MLSGHNGRPEPEVIMNYADGFSYSKGKMEEAFRPGGILEKPLTKAARDPAIAALKREDIDLVMHEFEISRPQAERILVDNDGDLKKALESLAYTASFNREDVGLTWTRCARVDLTNRLAQAIMSMLSQHIPHIPSRST